MKANKYQMCSWVVTLVLALSGTALPLLMDEVIDTTGMETLRSLKLPIKQRQLIFKKTNRCQTIKVKKLQESVKIEVSSVKNAMKMFFSVLQDGKIRHVQVYLDTATTTRKC